MKMLRLANETGQTHFRLSMHEFLVASSHLSVLFMNVEIQPREMHDFPHDELAMFVCFNFVIIRCVYFCYNFLAYELHIVKSEHIFISF